MKSLNIPSKALVILLAFFTVSQFACRPPDKPVAEITVEDIDGNTIEDCRVRVYCVPAEQVECTIDCTVETNVSGFVSLDFEHPAVLRMYAYKWVTEEYMIGENTYDTTYFFCGEGNLRLEMDEITKETITVYECIEQ